MRVATALQRKPNENPLAKSSQDPFMDPEPELTVRVRVAAQSRLSLPTSAPCDFSTYRLDAHCRTLQDDLISSTHQLLLNKFNVVDYHLLIGAFSNRH